LDLGNEGEFGGAELKKMEVILTSKEKKRRRTTQMKKETNRLSCQGQKKYLSFNSAQSFSKTL
jgi:hypothetical protein